MRRVMFGVMGAGALVCSVLAAEAAPDNIISCEAPVGWDATERTLKAEVGAENVEWLDLGAPGGGEMWGSRVYGKDPKKTFDVVWAYEDERAYPNIINVTQGWSEGGEATTAPEWKSPNGLYVGMSIEELEALNGKPFKISPEYGGEVLSWEGGRMKRADDDGCSAMPIFAVTGAGTPMETLDEKEIMSNDKVMAKAKVSRFTVFFFRAEDPPPAAETP